MKKLKVGVIGIGNMGTVHAKSIVEGKVPSMELCAVCDLKQDRLDYIKDNLGENIALFTDYKEMFASGKIEAAIVAVPHYLHPVMVMDGFKAGLHMLTEKPAGVDTKAVSEMNEAAKKTDKVFGIMFNCRTIPVFIKAKELIDSGELGELRRTNWIVTNWFRSQAYHDSSAWRSTWKTEGGGVLVNQAPHQLDLFQWLCGMPVEITAKCRYGSFCDIEVEDEVHAILKYENGATGCFVTSTSEWPGTNRLEIVGTRGKLLIENNSTLTFSRLRKDIMEFNANVKSAWEIPEVWECSVPTPGTTTGHNGILENFAQHILNGTELMAKGEEGIFGVTLADAMLMSDWKNEPVKIPFNNDEFYNLLQEKIEKSTHVKKSAKDTVSDISNTYTYSK